MPTGLPPAARPDPVEELDVAVVGAGVAGCYVAYRLADPALARGLGGESPLAEPVRAGRRPRVALFEADARIGGRLWSVPVATGEPPCELGAMRFPAGSPVLEDLLHHLDLGDRVAPFPGDRPENLVFLRGVRLRRGRLAASPEDGQRLPYRLGAGEAAGGPDALEGRLAERALPGFSDLRAVYHRCAERGDRRGRETAEAEYREVRSRRRMGGRGLHHLAWPRLLELTCTPEAAAYLEAVGGYECSTSRGSVACWLDELFFTPPASPQRCLRGGFQELPQALHRRFEARGGSTRRRHRLVRIERASGTATEPSYHLVFVGPARQTLRVQAGVVVLTLPRPALERLDRDGPVFASSELRAGLAGVIGVPALKLFLGYRRPWWRRTGVVPGRSTTDLPIRQVHYRPASDGAPVVLLAAYANGPDVEYWQSLDDGEAWSWDPFPGLAPEDTPRAATRRMVEAAHGMLLRLHGVAVASLPELAFCQDWSAPPHGAAWHVWRPGAPAGEIERRMLRPLAGERVFVVGECWSSRPGSVPGALASCERLLREHLRVESPGWLTDPRPLDDF